ncbi:thiamine pyrophosphate-binding protein [Rhizobium sp. NTR19]|uniref:Thiamine pyrophosphate-binding protein n=1 Tax=Neorhizobium turbinariae TaxID=2937795 RepID=A0ABT0ILM4_9HYPH|nr:thiamine pyrophosphate-binding protein [Neorhizobium turbinariae]MCK8778782.1 thiamine pyrophosphate-binding protein [Neorhizobium turbinariae]
MQMTIGQFLLKRLTEIGIEHMFGVPGDYNLQFLEQVKACDGLQFVGNCNELNAAYAADGYARLKGAGALLTTYGVGELSAICGVAGAAAEHVPVVCITGAPPLHAMEQRLPLHHTLADGNYDDMMICFRQFTAAQTRITFANAVGEIDRVLTTCLREKKPVYIQLPSDVSYLTVEAPDAPLDLSFASDPRQLEAAVEHALRLWSQAKRPALLTDMDADRLGLRHLMVELVGKAAVPYASLTTGKAILSETHALWVGHYLGEGSSVEAKAWIEESDCLITTAPRFIEFNSGHFTQNLPKDHTIMLAGHSVTIGSVRYEGVNAQELLRHLLQQVPERAGDNHRRLEEEAWSPQADAPLTQERLWQRMARFIKAGDTVLAESGTSNIGLTSQALAPDVTYISANIWGSIGYTLPATLGTALAAPDRRHLLFIGDGSFQLTAQELSTLLRLELKPIIFLLNNRGYTIERYILGMQEAYNDVANWKYAELAGVFSEKGNFLTAHARTEGELEAVLEKAAVSNALTFIELHLDPFDAPAALKKFGPATAEFDYGPLGPQRLSA